jgi:hypothetical protein
VGDPALRRHSQEAKAEDCKSFIPGSSPGAASIPRPILPTPKYWNNGAMAILDSGLPISDSPPLCPQIRNSKFAIRNPRTYFNTPLFRYSRGALAPQFEEGGPISTRCPDVEVLPPVPPRPNADAPPPYFASHRSRRHIICVMADHQRTVGAANG